MQMLVGASDKFNHSQWLLTFQWSSVVDGKLAELTIATIKHLGSCLSGENNCLPV